MKQEHKNMREYFIGEVSTQVAEWQDELDEPLNKEQLRKMLLEVANEVVDLLFEEN